MMRPFLHISDINSLTAFEFETVCRNYTQYAYLDNHTALCRVLSKYKMYVDTRDLSVTPHMILDGFWETWLTQCLARIIQPGDTCIDIGANLGYYSILMSALAGDKGHTIAVEPNPHLCHLLRSTAGINNPGFAVAEYALTDKAGKMTLYIPDNFLGDASIIERPARTGTHKAKIKVQALTLDSLLAQMNVPKVDIIKMDVEGAEPMVFEGMPHTIAKNPSLRIIIEYSPHLYTDSLAFTKKLFTEFSVHRIGDGIEAIKESAIEELLQLAGHTDLYLTRK